MLYGPLDDADDDDDDDDDEPDDDDDELDDEQAAAASRTAAVSGTILQSRSLRPVGRVRSVAELLCLLALITRRHHPRHFDFASLGLEASGAGFRRSANVCPLVALCHRAKEA
jgi:hypothetical protein